MNRKISIILISLTASSAIIVYFFAPLELLKSKEKKFIVAVNIPQTGGLATIGEQIKSGMDLAIKNIQDSSFQIIYQDSKGNARDGLNATNYLLNDNNNTPNFIIVNLTSVAMASKSILNSSEDVNALYLSTHPEITKNCKNCFRFFTSGVQESDILVQEIIKNNPDKLGLIYVKDAYGEGTISYIKKSLENINPSIKIEELSYTLDNYNFQTILTNARNMDISSFVLIGYGFEYEDFFTKLKQFDYTPNIYSNFSFSNKQGKEINNYEGDIIFTAPKYDIVESRSKTMDSFTKIYIDEYHSEPDFNAAYGYDNINIIYAFYKSKGNNFHEFLSSYNFSGAMGKYQFLSDGDTKTELQIRKR